MFPAAFSKHHSLGNDFIIFDLRSSSNQQIKQSFDGLRAKDITALCDRHFGIGADGVLCVLPAVGAHAEVVIYNSDGSLGGMCLNGLRCVAAFIAPAQESSDLTIIMSSRTIICRVQKTAEGTFVESYINGFCLSDQHVISTPYGDFSGTPVDVGNPHFIIEQQVERSWLEAYGKHLESHQFFPHKANIEFVWPLEPNLFNLLVYERACGVTLACSSGAAATAMHLYKKGVIDLRKPIIFRMLGGDLEAEVIDGETVRLRGSAYCVAAGNQFITAR